MSLLILLDAGPLGLITNPRLSPDALACTRWLRNHVADGSRVVVPEIADYEVRRELLRADKVRGIERLDAFEVGIEYAPITMSVMRLAAEFWAQARKQGRPSAPDLALDADVILAATASVIPASEGDVIVATTNVRHLAQFVDARHWRDIHV